jgi:hypothetical protein
MPAQHLVDALLPLHAILADELGTDDQRLEVMAIADDLQMLAGQTCGDDRSGLVQAAS